MIGNLPPLPTVTRLLDRMRRRVGDEDFVWQRGLKYAEDRRVAYLKLRGDQVEAGVKGSRRYLVSVSWPPGNPERFEGRCTCPYARKGICKHMVAMAMTLWFATQKTEEDEANAQLAAAKQPLFQNLDIGKSSDMRKPRGGIAAGSALPLWLANLLDKEESAPPPRDDGPCIPIDANEPWISFDLLPGAAEPMPIEVRVARMGPGMRPTRGRKVHQWDRESLRDLEEEVRLLPEDEILLSYLSNRMGTDSNPDRPWDPASLDRLIRLMAHTRDVRVHGNVVKIVPTPLNLRLVVSDHGEDKIRFWVELNPDDDNQSEGDQGTSDGPADAPAAGGPIPGLKYYIPASPGWVCLNDGTVRPLTLEGTRLLRTLGALNEDQLPTVSGKDLDRFREREWPLLGSRYPVKIATEVLPNVISPEPIAKLYLTEPSPMALGIATSFSYAIPEGEEILIGPDSPHFLLPDDPSKPTVRRNPDLEARLLAQVITCVASARGIDTADLPADLDPWDITLDGEDALAFLANELISLEDRFIILGDENLNKLKVHRGDLETQGRVKSETDWFDLKLGFSSGEALASAAEVLRAWKKQRRFVKMDNGSYARIPEKWLERFGVLLEEAEFARKELGGKLPAYMASLGTALSEAVDNFVADDNFSTFKNLFANPETLEPVPLPKGLQAELRSYQKVGYTWLCWLADHGFGGCLADDMGLGKTVQALAFIQRQKEKNKTGNKPTLVVAPTSVLFNWEQETNRFCPKLSVVLYQGVNRKKAFHPGMKNMPDIVVTSYPLLRIDADVLTQTDWGTVILDESQHIKNADSQTSRAAFKLRADHRIVMTGTPLENRLDDLWSQFHFIMPGFLGRRKSFLQNYGIRSGQSDPETLKARLHTLRTRIEPFILRRLKQDVAKELPARTEMVLRLPLSNQEQKIYATVRDAYKAQVFSTIEEKGKKGATLTILEALLRLRQAACHPSLLPFEEAQALGKESGSTKIRTLIETLEEIVSEGHKALVFSQWTSLLDLASAALKKSKIPTVRLDGSTKNRASVVESFQSEGGAPVFLLSLKAGGTGLNLTAADYVIHLDPWWNPAAEAQANDRAHRIGQTRPVVIIKLVSSGTVEEKVVQLQQHKRALFDAAVEKDQGLEDLLGLEEMTSIFEADEQIPEIEVISERLAEQLEQENRTKSSSVRRRRNRPGGRRTSPKGKPSKADNGAGEKKPAAVADRPKQDSAETRDDQVEPGAQLEKG